MKGSLTEERLHPKLLKETALTLLFLGTLGVVGWLTLEQILTIQENQSQFQDANTLEQQVAQLRSKFLQAEPEKLEAELDTAEKLLIENFSHLTQWGHRLQEKAREWDLQTKFRILKTEGTSAPIEGVILVPVEFQVLPQGNESAYHPFLQFVKSMTHSGPRVDIQDMTVLGNGHKATFLKVGLSVWMKATNSVRL